MKQTGSFAYYFLFFSAVAYAMPWLVPFYQGLNFTALEISLLVGMAPLISMLGAPLFTGIADATGRHKLIMSGVFIGVIIVAIMFPQAGSFLVVFILVALFSLFVAPASSLGDSATMHMLGDHRDMYGRVRLGGTIGYGLAAASAGYVIQTHGISWAFWGYASFMLLALIVCQRFTFSHKAADIAMAQDAPRAKINWRVFTSRRWVLFYTLVFIAGMGFSAFNNYLFPYMEDLGFSRTLMGISMAIATIGELPVLFFSNRLIRRVGAYGLLLLAMGAIGTRLLLYAWVTAPAGLLFFQLLNGMTFPLLWVAGVSYADENSPDGLKATSQGLFGSMTLGLGASVGGFIGGLMFGSLGGQWMYMIFGMFVFISLGVLLIVGRAERLRAERSIA